MSGIGIPIHSNSPISPVKTSTTSTSTATVPSNGQQSRPEISTTFNADLTSEPVSGAPPPQSKAIPSALASATTIRTKVPPPPKSGQTMKHPEDHQTASATQTQSYTPHTSAPPPRTTHNSQPAASITPIRTDHFPHQPAEKISLQQRHVAPSQDLVQSTNQETGRGSLEHPPGYMQNPNASDMTPTQCFATENSNQSSENSPILGYADHRRGSNAGFGEEDGVWDLAKKLVKSAGETLAEGEKKAWDYINNWMSDYAFYAEKGPLQIISYIVKVLRILTNQILKCGEPGGNVGRQVIKALLGEDSFSITAIIRATSSYTPPPSSKPLTTLTADFDSLSSLAKALENQDALLCCVPGGATHFASQRLLIDAAIVAGVKLFFASEYIADITGERYKLFPTNIVGDKLQVRHYLEEKAAEGKIAWTALNGGPFFDMWLTHPLHPAGFSLADHTATIYDDGTKPLSWTPLPAAAAAVVHMLRHPQGILNRAVHVRGVKNLTQNALLEALEDQTGRTFSVERKDTGVIKDEVFGLLRDGEARKAMKGLTIWAQFGDGDEAGGREGGVDNEKVGVVEVSVVEAVREVLALEER